MTKSVQYYEEMGRDHARAGAKAASFPRSGTSWQAKAYWRGRDAENAAIQARKSKDPGPAPGTAPRGSLMGIATTRLPSKSPAEIQAPKAYLDKLRVVNYPALMKLSEYWPAGAKEHVRLLAMDHNTELRLGRRARLHRAIRRMVLRHEPSRRSPGNWADIAAVPMSMSQASAS
jgi:hypothetical protein